MIIQIIKSFIIVFVFSNILTFRSLNYDGSIG